jgi:hypothetical protein
MNLAHRLTSGRTPLAAKGWDSRISAQRSKVTCE